MHMDAKRFPVPFAWKGGAGGSLDQLQERSLHWVLMASIVVISLAVRIASLHFCGIGAIESDGAEYARIAENLRKGLGYVGIVTPGAELNFPPLLPLLIAGASFITRDYMQAGRLVALIAGALLPLPVFGITARLFGRRAAIIATALAIANPLLVNLSFAVLSEGPYLTLILTAVYLVLTAFDRPSIPKWCLIGGVFGVAYLLRPEALLPFGVTVVSVFFVTADDLGDKCKRAFAALVVFSLLTLPEVALLYKYTGRIQLTAKTTIMLAMADRAMFAKGNFKADHTLSSSEHDDPSPEPNAESWQPWPEKWGDHAVNLSAERTGTWMRTNADVIRNTRLTSREFAYIVVHAIFHNVPAALDQLSKRWSGAPFLPALALLGAVRRPWKRENASRLAFVAIIAATPIVATFTTLWVYPRFYFLLVPIMLIPAANGLLFVAAWGAESGKALGWRRIDPAVIGVSVSTLFALALLIYSVNGVRSLFEFSQSSPSTLASKEAGEWIEKQQHSPVKVMDLTVPLAFHADAEFAYFPYCSGETALRFLDTDHVDYIVLRRDEQYTQYYAEWLAHGIPDPRAQLVYVSPAPDAGEIMVYRWHRT